MRHYRPNSLDKVWHLLFHLWGLNKLSPRVKFCTSLYMFFLFISLYHPYERSNVVFKCLLKNILLFSTYISVWLRKNCIKLPLLRGWTIDWIATNRSGFRIEPSAQGMPRD